MQKWMFINTRIVYAVCKQIKQETWSYIIIIISIKVFSVPLLEITIKDSVRETLSTDPDTFQHTVAA